MKYLLIAFAFILSVNVNAQSTFENEKDIFVRVYDLSGKKINRGNIVSYTDDALKLIRKGEEFEIPATTIGSIKTKHSVGNNMLIGTLAGVGAGFITADLAVVAGGAAVGAAVGGISALFKKTETFDIEGDGTKLKQLETLKE